MGASDDWLQGPAQYLLPSILMSLDYAREPAVVAFVQRAVRHEEGRGTVRNDTWHPWEGIFEYMACVEYARARLRRKGDRSGGDRETFVLYHTRSLIFFAQATLDLVAGWLNKQFDLKAKGGDISFSKDAFRNKLAGKSEEFCSLIKRHRDFADELTDYRMEWIHRIAGRPIMTVREKDSDYTVPIDPTTDWFQQDSWKEKSEQARQRHGRDSYEITEFADRFCDGTSNIVLSALLASLNHPDTKDGPEF